MKYTKINEIPSRVIKIEPGSFLVISSWPSIIKVPSSNLSYDHCPSFPHKEFLQNIMVRVTKGSTCTVYLRGYYYHLVFLAFMHLPTPMIKHSVRSSSRDNSAFMKMSNYLNIPTASEEGLKLRSNKEIYENDIIFEIYNSLLIISKRLRFIMEIEMYSRKLLIPKRLTIIMEKFIKYFTNGFFGDISLFNVCKNENDAITIKNKLKFQIMIKVAHCVNLRNTNKTEHLKDGRELSQIKKIYDKILKIHLKLILAPEIETNRKSNTKEYNSILSNTNLYVKFIKRNTERTIKKNENYNKIIKTLDFREEQATQNRDNKILKETFKKKLSEILNRNKL
ncbi:hypothetical protein H8356DRAFT_1424327 [Neocallimastix lanati (nom. inval.)]|nr:hypothetical protein H8356DRAFT_1424327 [Neocallimastix sp. JGI-2020a]